MPDKEMLIRAWEMFRDSNPYQICSGREFRAIKEPEYCMGQMIQDTITLLKDKKSIRPRRTITDNKFHYDYCGACGVLLPVSRDYSNDKRASFCPERGTEVNWT